MDWKTFYCLDGNTYSMDLQIQYKNIPPGFFAEIDKLIP